MRTPRCRPGPPPASPFLPLRNRGGRKALRRLAALPALLLLLFLAAFSLPPGSPSAASPAPPAPQRGTSTRPLAATSYELAWRSPFNRPSHYPLDRRPDPALYRPHAPWMGRLILPAASESGPDRPGPPGHVPPDPGPAGSDEDWVWVEIAQAPPEAMHLVGRRVRLAWQSRPELEGLLRAVTTEVRLGEPARRLARAGNVVPERLDGRRQVGPLRSLAGARPHDDVTVALEDVRIAPDPGGEPVLRIGRSPVQITGRWTALVRLVGPESGAAGAAHPGEIFRVHHYDRRSGRFDGPIERVRLPRQPRDRFGRRFFDPRGLETSAAGRDGWYLHGSPDATGLFTVQALEPRSLLRLHPDQRLEGTPAGLRHLTHGNWSHTPEQRGRLRRVALWPDGGRRSLLSPRGSATGTWEVGDQALVIHGFGGIGGREGEPTPGFTVTGHFAFGQAEVIRDPFTGEPRFRVRYHQIYASNPNGIVAGTQDWSAFSGDLQRGWLGTRPISDVLVEGDAPLLRELALQAEVLMARYRSGDGSGVASVTPATSCVQDSAQALFLSIDQLRRRAAASPAVAAAARGGGEDADRLRRLAALGRSLDDLLTPFGMVRPDWRRNASLVAAAAADPRSGSVGDRFVRGEGLGAGILSWRSMLPRRAHDDIARVFLRHGSPLWILRTNQLPGADPALEPLAPTLLLGRLPLVSTLLRRFTDALFTPLTAPSLALSLALLAAYGVAVVPAGFRSGFLVRRWWSGSGLAVILRAGGLLLMPALVEEMLFRVALLPHPLEGEPLAALLGWGALSTGLFTAYHPVAGRLWYPQARIAFHDPRFLVPCALLGVACAIAYEGSGSLWPPVLLHWFVVLAWLQLLGGWRLLRAAAGTPPLGAVQG